MGALKGSTDEPRVSPGRQNRRKRMSSTDAKKDGRKKAKVDGDTETLEVNNLGISWFAPFTVLSTSSISFFRSLRETLRVDNLVSTDQFHFTRKSQRAIGQESSRVVENELPGLVCNDLCNGKENICIPVTNEVDVPPVAPEKFAYLSSIEVAKNLVIPASAEGCNCKGKCTNTRTCSCASLNGSDFPYVRKAGGGRLFEPKAVVFECGPNCGCGPKCVNRTSQQGLKYRLEVYKTPDKGWAVRSWDFIPSGGYVCEYTGVLTKTSELDNVSVNDYFFEIDCEHTMNGIGVREKRLGEVPIPNGLGAGEDGGDKLLEESDPDYCIDAGSSGNVARFINHSCEPNLFVQCVLSSHHDVKLARIVLFASDDIPPMQELTYDYGYELDSVVGADGKVKELACHCGTADCRKRLY
ncbi:histone-lysine N-methyltransferase, H3 lysine-9 specific SUVH4-like [Rosa sericea]